MGELDYLDLIPRERPSKSQREAFRKEMKQIAEMTPYERMLLALRLGHRGWFGARQRPKTHGK